MAQDDAAPSTARTIRALGRVATITRVRDQQYSVDWTPPIDWQWVRIGAKVAPWCSQCGAIVGGAFTQRRLTDGQKVHEEWHEALEKWFDQIDADHELLGRIALLLKQWLPREEDSTDGNQGSEDSSPAFYDDPGDDDSGEDG